MASHAPAEADPQELEKARHVWGNFTKAMKWAVIVVAAVLIFLAVAFVG